MEFKCLKGRVSLRVGRSSSAPIKPAIPSDMVEESIRTYPQSSALERIGLTLTVAVPIIGALLAGAISANAFIHGGVLSMAMGYMGLVVAFACLWVAYLAGCYAADTW